MNPDAHVLLQNALHNQPSLAHGVTSRSLDSGFRRNDGGARLPLQSLVFWDQEKFMQQALQLIRNYWLLLTLWVAFLLGRMLV
jgi:hypothetical protein